MIDQSLSLVVKQLNQFLKNELQVDYPLVELSNIPVLHSVAKLHLTMVSMEEDRNIRSQSTMGYGNKGWIKGVMPIHLNLQFLISVSTNTPYVEGLKYLSLAILYFQQNPFFSIPDYELPKGINKIMFEIINLNTEMQGNLWQSIGASYKPSVLYRMRGLEIKNIN